ncbi:NlpC/P60 family protein [Sphingorhabdus arenilitoris]|uniref:NlpC/P60 family protein n=1 Tax=Sphingorhabdus arenilitoris TaxID=1490041 RepID=A0ABV8REX6_9SPHN
MANDDVSEAIAARALAQIGVAFKLHGRKAGAGLDCVGLTAHAMDVQHDLPCPPRDYHMAGDYIDQICTYMEKCGFGFAAPDAPLQVGDIILLRPGPRQQHLGIWTGAGLVHAHAGIRRVVFTPGQPVWPVCQIWRKKGD